MCLILIKRTLPFPPCVSILCLPYLVQCSVFCIHCVWVLSSFLSVWIMSSFCRQLAIHIILSDCQTKLYVSFLSRNEELERESSYANPSQFLMSCILYSISTNSVRFLTMAMAHMARVILKSGCFLTSKTSLMKLYLATLSACSWRIYYLNHFNDKPNQRHFWDPIKSTR